MNKIKVLPQNIINQIAAGEVIERPASIIKELLENSLDAGAKNIEISFNNGGKSFINIKDDGSGMSQEDLALCLKIHATSKLTNQSLHNINTLGFRGEALASICAVAKIEVASFDTNKNMGFLINGANTNIEKIEPFAIQKGTNIKVLDLFFFTPARLKFLKSENTESLQCYKIIKKIALANPSCSFKVFNNSRLVFNYLQSNSDNYQSFKLRCEQIIGKNFIQNSVFIKEENPMFTIKGFISNPTFNLNTTEEQFIIVNNRVIKDKTLSYAIKQAYGDVLSNYKQPIYALWIDIDPEEIDVNVNPSKTEVRFKDIALVRHIIYNLVKKSLSLPENQINNTTLTQKILNKTLESNNLEVNSRDFYKNSSYNNSYKNTNNSTLKPNNYNNLKLAEATDVFNYYYSNEANANKSLIKNENINLSQENFLENISALGFAKAQVHKNWIITQTQDGFIIIDQHAAHERITQEKLLNQFLKNSIVVQTLLLQEDIELEEEQILVLKEYRAQLNRLGINFTINNNIVNIAELPALISTNNPKNIILDIINNLKETESVNLWDERLKSIINKIACHYSIRSGKTLNEHEMNSLIKEMLKTPNYGQCSHGRPTFIAFSIKDIEKLFGRS